MKKKLLIVGGILAIAAAIFVWQNFLKTAPPMKRLDAEHKGLAVEFYAAFEENEEQANQKFLNKIVELTGELESIDVEEGSKPVLNLKTEGFGMVKCTMESDMSRDELGELELNSTISVRGECLGYLLDVLLGRCIIIN